ncbi:Glycosyltransferase involved in cell wall bisynthesis [Microbacterium sp. cf046]|uniref:glycosyltransferase n=1 Tax=Microbacterium sp. cf046 TaxID=1761803 RepID=UPI0008E64242|nr:glycosyltransferase [Microbacterium sp. cf046]SFR91068.1 Glycosyltransferase involved in cell wall bisynthesis [Microbacterium sp. cf046]
MRRRGRRPGAGSLRVLHLDHTSAPGGAELALVRMLSARPSWQPILLVPPSGREGAYGRLPATVPVRAGGVTQPSGVSAGGARTIVGGGLRLALQAAATRFDPAFRTADVVDANTARSAAYGALAAVTSRVPFVIHLRDLVRADALGRFGFETMARLALPRADGVVANSRATLESARPFLRADAITAVIPSASGLTFGAPPGGREPGPLRIGMLARIDPWKGQMLLLEAFAEAFPGGDERLVLAGSAPFGHAQFMDDLRIRAAELRVEERVDLLGHVEDVPAVLGQWDIAVQASLRPEPLGQNVLQYLAAGVATIVADEGGPTEWVEDERNGIRVTPRDPDALTVALQRLGGDAALRTKLALAARATPGLLTDDEVMRAHAEFYRAVLDGRQPQGTS